MTEAIAFEPLLSHPQLTSPALFLLIVLLSAVLVLYLRHRPAPVPASLPGPPRSPLVGVSTFDYDWRNWPTACLELSRSCGFATWGGPTIDVGFGPAFFVVLSEENVRHVLRDNFDNYVKGGPGSGCTSELFGDVLFAADGDRWRVHRRAVSSRLSEDETGGKLSVISGKVDQVSDVLDGVAREAGGRAEGDDAPSVDIQDLFMRMTLDVAMDIAFDVKMDSVGELDEHRGFLEALDELKLLCHDRYQDIFYEIKQFLGLTERERRMRKLVKVVNDYADRMVQRIMDRRDGGGGTDVLSHFVSCSKEAGRDHPTKEELRYMLMNLVFAGKETTSCALSWSLYELLKHPDVAAKLIKEVETICGAGPDAVYSHQNIGRLEYTHAVIMEVLRLHPPTTDDWRMAVDDDVLPDGTRIPRGSCVMYSPYTMNHSPKIWGDDAEKFRPDRFLGSTQPSSFKFPVFNAGPRICPGRALALLEIKVAIVKLLTRFSFKDAKGHSGEYRWALVLAMKDGFHVAVTRRT